jgi:PHD/YefM family antitoxin component YafN of YafNO toxin-antitoxin module
MRTLDISEAASQLPALIDDVKYEPLAIERDGESIAFLVSVADYEASRETKKQAFFAAWNRLSLEIDEKVARGEINRDELMKSLDRKAS